MAISVGVLVSPKLNSFHLLHAHRWTAIPYIHHLLRRRRRRQRSCRRRVLAVYHHLNVADAYVRLSAYRCCCWLFSGDCFFFFVGSPHWLKMKSVATAAQRAETGGIFAYIKMLFGNVMALIVNWFLVEKQVLSSHFGRFGRCRWFFEHFIVWCARVYRDKYITRTKRALDVGSKFWSPKDYIEDFCGLFKAIFNTTWTNSVW